MSEDHGVPIIGFDLGHAETSVSLGYSHTTTPPHILDLTGASGNGRQHVTAVAEHPERGVLVGEAAVNAHGVDHLYVAFKRPCFTDKLVNRPTRLLVEQIRRDGIGQGLLPSDGRQRWVFGAPSGWNPATRDGYAAVLRGASGLDGTGVEVEVIPESRAALLYARDSGELPVRGGTLTGTVLIIDVGSSTTDFTTVVGHRLRPPADSGTALGASLIDRVILDRAVAASPHRDMIEKNLRHDPLERLRLELLCRRVKEEYFRTGRDRILAEPDNPPTRIRSLNHGGEQCYLRIRLSAEEMRAVLDTRLAELGGQTWPQAFRADLLAVAGTLERPPDAVLITGGASRMWFVPEITRELFGADTVYLGAEPEAAIARGLALAGRVGIRAAGFRTEVATLIASDRVTSLVADRLPGLALMIGGSATDRMTERHVIPAFRRWRSGQIDTLNEMADGVAAAMRAELLAGDNARLTEATTDWQNQLRPALEQMTRPICNRWHIPPGAMSLPPVDSRTQPDGLRLTAPTEPVTESLRRSAVVVSTAIVGALTATALVSSSGLILATGPVGTVIGLSAIYIGIVVGREAALSRATSARLPLAVRRLVNEEKVIQKLRQEATGRERELATAIAAQFLGAGGPRLTEAISASVARQLEAQAADAELLIR